MFLNVFLIYTPLEQFDNFTWSIVNHVWEGESSFFFLYNQEALINNVSDFFLNQNSIFPYYLFLERNNIFIFYSVVGMLFLLLLVSKSNSFYFIFFIGFLHLLTGFFVFFWFNYVYVNSFVFATKPILFFLEEHPQINFTFFFDENLITFLIAFFFWGGSEDSSDENFLLEKEDIDFIDDIVSPLFIANLGKNVKDNASLYLKVSSIFGFILLNNLMGMIPYSDTGTSSLILTFWVSLSIFTSLLFLMITKQGFNHFFGLFMPAGCPLPLILLLVPIEFISYVFRVVSISVRLFANMMAGHTLLKVIVGFSWTIILLGDTFILVHLVPVLILFILSFLELSVAMIQAYVFTVLVCMYLRDIFVGH